MTTTASAPVSARVARPTRQPAIVKREPWLPTSALSAVLVLAAMVCGVVAGVLLVGFDGWHYYRAPIATRGYLPQHDWLRPSGVVGLSLGIAGVVAMLCTLPYLARKRWQALSRFGTMRGWLETHIFFGVVGPVLITFHTSFKFNGLISVAYWLMALVWASGFVGRYLYVRIPKTIRGAELTRADVERELALVSDRCATLPAALAGTLTKLQRTLLPADGRAPGVFDLFFGELIARVRLALAARHLREAGVDVAEVRRLLSLVMERATLARRLAHLERARRMFELWHLFHRPLVVALFLIVAVHVGVAVFFGYAHIAG